MTGNDPLFFIYETAQVPLAKLHQGTVVALDQEVLALLAEEGVEAVALPDISRSPDGNRELLERTRAMAKNWYAAPEASFLSHDGILLGEQYEVAVLYYLQTLVYYVSVLSQALAHFSSVRQVVVSQTHVRVPKTADPTAQHKENLPVDVLRLLCERNGIALTVIPAPETLQGQRRALWRAIEQFFVRVAVRLSNALITRMSAQRPIRLFSSDPWYRIAPFVQSMPDLELVMSRRTELKSMGLARVRQARARFHHGLDFTNAATDKVAREGAQRVRREWEAMRDSSTLAAACAYEGIEFWPVARRMFDTILCERIEGDISTIESTKRLFAHYRINCVLLFASTKGYNLVLSRIAERVGIPSIELQHALTNDEKTLVHCRLNSRYLASYGPLTNRMYESWGVTPERLVAVGSPRFDLYARPDLDAAQALREKLGLGSDVAVLCNIPQIYLSLEYGNYTSWEVYDYIQNLAWSLGQLPVQPLLRPKPGVWHQSFYHRKETSELFSQGVMVQNEPMQALLWACDIVVSSSSTMVLEALLAHKPTVMYVPKLLDHDFDAFVESGAVRMARTKEELLEHLRLLVGNKDARSAQVKAGDAFINGSFMIDGGSAKRVEALIRRVTEPSRSSTMPL